MKASMQDGTQTYLDILSSRTRWYPDRTRSLRRWIQFLAAEERWRSPCSRTVMSISAGAITQLSTGEYLKNGATIVISGPTGTGKSFLACALGERACRLGYKVRYYTVSRLMDELKLARLEGYIFRSMFGQREMLK